MEDTALSNARWEAAALKIASRHPVMMAAWHVSDVIGSLATRVQDAIEARLGKTAGPV